MMSPIWKNKSIPIIPISERIPEFISIWKIPLVHRFIENPIENPLNLIENPIQPIEKPLVHDGPSLSHRWDLRRLARA